MTGQQAMSNQRLKALLKRLGACSEALEWLGNRDLETAWAECERGDYLLWATAEIGVERALIVRASARCAETALQYASAGEDRPRLCVEAVLAWADDPTKENLERVRQARRAAAAAAAADAARREALKRCADIVRETISFEAIDAAVQNRKVRTR